MKNRTILKKSTWLLMLCFASAIALSACKSTEEHPKKSEHPTQEHPTTTTTNAPAQKP